MNVEFELKVVIKGRSLQEVDEGLIHAAGERLKARMLNPPVGALGTQVKTAAPAQAPTPPPVTTTTTVERHETPMPVATKTETVEHHPAPAAPAPAPAATVDAPAPKKRGRKPGTKFGSYKKKEKTDAEQSHSHAGEENSSDESQAPISGTAEGESLPEGNTDGAQEGPAAQETDDTLSRIESAAADAAPSGPKRIPSNEEAGNALKAVNSRFGIDRVRETLEKFGVKRCSELTEANRGAFVEYCESLTA